MSTDEMINVTYCGRIYSIPKVLNRVLEDAEQAIVDARKDAMRQMVIQLKSANLHRSVAGVPDPSEASWLSFCFHFPAYMAMAGMPRPNVLGDLLYRYFPLSSIAYRYNTYCLKGNSYSFKTFEIITQPLDNRDPNVYALIIDEDAHLTLHRICEALRHIGYDFGIENPHAEWDTLAYSHRKQSQP